MYADAEYYSNVYCGGKIPPEQIDSCLKKASRHIDSLTFNRIQDIENLTDFQQRIVREVCCEMADFEYENSDTLDSILQGYSINGVSMNFSEGLNVKIVNGITVKSDIYRFLCQTGLCCRLQR